MNGGSGYISIPELIIEDGSSPAGTGAILRPVLQNGKITDIIVINEGIGYSTEATSIYIKSRGSGAKFDSRVRYLDINDAERFAGFAKNQTNKIFSNLYKNEKEDSLVYGIFGYSEDLAEKLGHLMVITHQLLDGHMMEIQSMVPLHTMTHKTFSLV